MKSYRWIAVFFILCFFTSGHGFAQSTSYDPYAPIYKEEPQKESLKDFVSTLIAFPFEVVKYPVDKTLVYIEDHMVPRKLRWIYRTLKNNGITPHGSYTFGRGGSAGLELDVPQMFDLNRDYPDLVLDGWIFYGDDIYFQTGTEFGLKNIGQTGLSTTAFIQYEDRFEEDFYGIGPDSSLGDGATFGKETTTFEGRVGYEFRPGLQMEAKIAFNKVNIEEGEDRGKGQLDKFGLDNIPNIGGDEILSLEYSFTRDTRDFKDNPTQGSYQKFGLSYHEGLDNSSARFFRYTIDAAKYISLGSPRRVLAFRVFGQHNDEINGGTVPFYEMSTLGGYGTFPRLSRTFRGYTDNRFFDESAILFNVEYRYTVWEYRDFQADAVLFFDEGQVFGEFSDFKISDFDESYGAELRFSFAKKNFLNIAVARSSEGSQFYVKTKKSF